MKSTRLPLSLFGLLFWSIFSAHSSYSQSEPLPKALLWRVSGNGFPAPSYLYGTMHLRDKSLFQFTDSVYAAIRQTRQFALEIHPDTLASVAFSQVAMAASRRPAESNGGGKAGKKKPVKTKVLNNMPTIVDLYLYGVARDLGKRLEGLESVQDQVDYTANFREESNDFFDGSQFDQQLLERVKAFYVQGDIQQVFSVINEIDDQDERNRTVARNTVMAGRIAALGGQSPVFAAVGAAHLGGELGLINQLRMRGFSVEPVTNGKPLPAGHYAFSRPPSWVSFADPGGYFQVDMPGSVRSFSAHEMGYLFHGTVDLAQLRFYFAGSMPMIGVLQHQKDSLLRLFSRNMVSMGTYTVLRETVLRDSTGIYGRDIIFYDVHNEIRFRFQVQLRAGRIFLLGVAAPEDRMLEDMVSVRFLQSFQPLEIQDDPAGYRWTDGVAELNLPVRPESAVLPAGDSTMRAVQWSTVDPGSALFYILVRTDANPGFVISSDSAYFADVASGFGANTQTTMYGLKDTVVQGYPARRFFARSNEEDVFIEALLVKQGSRIYALVITATDSASTEAKRNTFFRSFRLTTPVSNRWSWQRPASGGFTAWSPGPWHIDHAESQIGSRTTFYSYDSLTSTSYQMITDTLSTYAWSSSDTALLSMSSRDYVFDRHPLLERRFIRIDGLPALELITRCEDSTMVKKVRMVIKGRIRYTQFVFVPAAWLDDPHVRRYFEDLRLPADADSMMVYRNKPSRLLDDIIGTDQDRTDAALESLVHAPFVPADIPLLLDYGLRAPASNAERADPGRIILNRAGELARESPEQEAFVIREVSQRYRSDEEGARRRSFELLDILVRMQTTASHEAILSLLEYRLPDQGDPFSMVYHMRDSTALARILYPKILDWSADSILGMPAFSLHPFMMEEKRIGQEMVEAHRAGVDAGLDRMIRYNASAKESDNWWYAYRAVEFIAALEGPHWNQWLYRFVALPQPEIKMAAAITLAKRKEAVPASVWDTLASIDRQRAELQRELERIGQKKLFPEKYRSQRHFAVASLWESTDDEEAARIEFIGTEDMDFQGKRSRFFLYRVIFESDGERSVYLGIAGPYKPKDRALLPVDPVTGVHWTEEYTRGLEKKQLRAYLDQFVEPPPGIEKIKL